MKRSFLREHGRLVDKVERPDGQPITHYVPACMLGEDLTADERDQFLGDLGSGSNTEDQSIFALNCERSEEYVDGLLRSLKSGNISSPMALTSFLDDPRVQPAIVESVRAAPLEHLANFAQVAGLVGGQGSRQALRDRLTELKGNPKVIEDDDFHNWHAGSLQTVAESLLRLEPDANDAAEALISLINHPCRSNHESAVWTVSNILQGELTIEIRRILHTAIEPFIDEADSEVFLRAAPVYLMSSPDKTLDRINEILSDNDADLRHRAIGVLMGAPSLVSSTAISCLIAHLEKESSINLRVEITRYLDTLAPKNIVREVIEAALSNNSPTVRLEGVNLLALLNAKEASKYARAALRDEPDDILRARLTKHTPPLSRKR